MALSFTDGIRFEILPVFVNAAGTFNFADTHGGGSWRACDPRSEMQAFSARNSNDANGNLKALCRMARIWRDRHTVPLSGMLIDTLAFQFIAAWPYRLKSYLYHDCLFRDFMLYLASVDRKQSYWRAPGSGSHVSKTGSFRRHAAASYHDAQRAIEHENNGRPTTARNKWREVFGPIYP